MEPCSCAESALQSFSSISLAKRRRECHARRRLPLARNLLQSSQRIIFFRASGEHRLTGSRVLVVAPEPFYEDRGTPIAVCQLLKALSQLSYEVDLLTYPIGSDVDIPGVRCLRTSNPLGIRRVPIGFSLRKVLFDV